MPSFPSGRPRRAGSIRLEPVLIGDNLGKIEPVYQEFSPLQEISGVIKYQEKST
jgi:hypothetical protein